MSNTNFTGLKYKKNFGDGLTFVGNGFAGYTYIDKARNSYISNSTPLLTSSFTLGLTKNLVQAILAGPFQKTPECSLPIMWGVNLTTCIECAGLAGHHQVHHLPGPVIFE